MSHRKGLSAKQKHVEKKEVRIEGHGTNVHHASPFIQASSIDCIETGNSYLPTLHCYVDFKASRVFYAKTANFMAMSYRSEFDIDHVEALSVQRFVDLALQLGDVKVIQELSQYIQRSKQKIVFGPRQQMLHDYVQEKSDAKFYAACGLSKAGLSRPIIHMILRKLPAYTVNDMSQDSFVNVMIDKGSAQDTKLKKPKV